MTGDTLFVIFELLLLVPITFIAWFTIKLFKNQKQKQRTLEDISIKLEHINS